jgi:excisionase family DNA binding protein
MDYRDPDWVAERLGVDKNTLYRFLHDGTIPAIQLGRRWLISQERLEGWLAAETENQTRARRDAARSSEATVRRMEQFTADARAALKRAHAEARAAAHERLDTLHLLLGLALDGQSAAGRALKSLGVSVELVRRAIESKLSAGAAPPARRLGRNAQAKRAMRLAARLALKQGDNNPLSPVGTDHLLGGVFLARGGLGHELLAGQGITRKRLRDVLAKQ